MGGDGLAPNVRGVASDGSAGCAPRQLHRSCPLRAKRSISRALLELDRRSVVARHRPGLGDGDRAVWPRPCRMSEDLQGLRVLFRLLAPANGLGDGYALEYESICEVLIYYCTYRKTN